MRVLVTGSRDWDRPGLVYLELERVFSEVMKDDDTMVVVHGGCPTGTDKQADDWVKRLQNQDMPVDREVHEAKWNKLGRGAGFVRNAEMVSLGADLCLAFIKDESNGATHTEQLAIKSGIPTKTFRESNNMVKRVNDEVTIENARILFRNFKGEEGQFNPTGKRTFSIALDGDQARELKEMGWNVKTKPAREEGGDELHHLPVEVAYGKGRPPNLFLITLSRNIRTNLDENTVMLLDYAELDTIDLIIRPYNWEVNGQQGVKAYLKKGFFTLREDELDQKYSHIPDAADAPLAIENDVMEGEVVDEGVWENDDTQKELTR